MKLGPGMDKSTYKYTKTQTHTYKQKCVTRVKWRIIIKNITKVVKFINEKTVKLSQIVSLINIHILIHRHARCNCKLWNAL